jgi:sec-independent protein translocase protein TatC
VAKFQKDPNQLTLIEHLAELRDRLIKSLLGILVGFMICYHFSSFIFDLIRAPIAPHLPAGGLVFTGPLDKFLAHLKVSLLAGVIISTPWWALQVWKFLAPALYKNEKRLTVVFITVASILFMVGICFAYFVVFPMAFQFLLNFGSEIDKPMITINQYLGFFLITSLAFGVAFELPLLIVTLAYFGLVDYQFLKANRKYAILILAIFTAVITPPDLLSMLMMLGPMWLLYDLSTFGVKWMHSRRKPSNLN